MSFAGHANTWFNDGLAALRAGEPVTSRGRATVEQRHVTTTLTDPRKRVLSRPWRRWNPFFQIAEPVWILAGSRDADWILRYNRRLAAYLDGPDARTFHGAYGHRLRSTAGRDQLRDVITQLQKDPGSRRACATLHVPTLDNPDVDTADRPCNLAASWLLRDDKLAGATFARSNDYILGLPTNLVQFTTIQEFLAAALGAEPGPYTHFSSSLHLYADDPIAERLFRLPGAFDVYDHVAPTPMRAWAYPEEGWVTIAKLYAGMPLDADACPYWRTVSDMLQAWRDLEAGRLENAVARLCHTPGQDWAIAGLEFINRWARLRDRYREFSMALEAFGAGPERHEGPLAYITHDDLRD